MSENRNRRGLITGVALVAGGALAGAIVAGTLSANAASPSPSPTPGSTVQRGGPGVQENDGVPEAQEHRGGGFGHGLSLTGTVTAVGTDSVTIKPSTGAAKTYKVDSSSDIDKNGEAQLSALVVGDVVRFSVTATNTIDKLHAGDEAKDMPAWGQQPGTGA